MADGLADFDGVDDLDLEASEVVVRTGRETCGTRDLLLRGIIVFNRAHVNAGVADDAEIMRRFYGRCIRLRYRLSTPLSWVDIIRSNHTTPSSAERIQRALRLSDLHRGISRMVGQEVAPDHLEGLGLRDVLALTKELPGLASPIRRHRESRQAHLRSTKNTNATSEG